MAIRDMERVAPVGPAVVSVRVVIYSLDLETFFDPEGLAVLLRGGTPMRWSLRTFRSGPNW